MLVCLATLFGQRVGRKPQSYRGVPPSCGPSRHTTKNHLFGLQKSAARMISCLAASARRTGKRACLAKPSFTSKATPASMACGCPTGPDRGEARLNSRFANVKSLRHCRRLKPRPGHPSACLTGPGVASVRWKQMALGFDNGLCYSIRSHKGRIENLLLTNVFNSSLAVTQSVSWKGRSYLVTRHCLPPLLNVRFQPTETLAERSNST